MKKTKFILQKKHKSFEQGFQFEFDGDIIILSGINGVGKSQILNIIRGKERKINFNPEMPPMDDGNSTIIDSKVFIDEKLISKYEIEYRSFKENILIEELTQGNSQVYLNSSNQAWQNYTQYLLEPSNSIPHLQEFSNSCLWAKDILITNFGKDKFQNIGIANTEFKQCLQQNGFVWRKNDFFSNSIGEFFFNYAVFVAEEERKVGQLNLNYKKLPKAPWVELNELFEELNFNYRFNSNYYITGFELNEQPVLYSTDEKGIIQSESKRILSDLSDGEKAIISLCFASLNIKNAIPVKILLLDEYDAVLNPSLIKIFFKVVDKYFTKRGTVVFLVTHSPVTITLSPEESSFYEVFNDKLLKNRILQVSRDDYSELQIANDRFYQKILNQEERIKELITSVDSKDEIVIITEGKTDWKYFISALRYFHNKEEFLKIKEEFFLKYGSKQDVEKKICGCSIELEYNNTQLLNYLKNLVEQRKKIDNTSKNQIRIGIFDSDDKNIKFLSEPSLGVYGIILNQPDISTEFLFSNDEIKTESIDGKRLFIGTEFNVKTGRCLSNKNLSLGDNSVLNKAGKNTIIEHSVYNDNEENMALSKSKFSELVYKEDIVISEESWANFRELFEQISDIIPKTDKDENI